MVAETNASGAAVQINTYDEYGMPGSGNTSRFGYTGQMWIAEIGLYHYRNRVYNPRIGRFMQTDPIGQAGGINLYAYVGNDPINYTDPWGLKSQRRSGDDCMGTKTVTTWPDGTKTVRITWDNSAACNGSGFGGAWGIGGSRHMDGGGPGLGIGGRTGGQKSREGEEEPQTNPIEQSRPFDRQCARARMEYARLQQRRDNRADTASGFSLLAGTIGGIALGTANAPLGAAGIVVGGVALYIDVFEAGPARRDVDEFVPLNAHCLGSIAQ